LVHVTAMKVVVGRRIRLVEQGRWMVSSMAMLTWCL